jgi:hypothetical protein
MRRPVLSWYDPTTDEVRVGNAERDAAATQLGAHLTAGRLQWDEYDQRLQAAYAAKTRGDLARLFLDLPEEEARARRRRASASADRPPIVAILLGLALGLWLLVKFTGLVTFVVTFILIRFAIGMLMTGPHGRGRRGPWGHWYGPGAAWCGPGAAWGGPWRRYGGYR